MKKTLSIIIIILFAAFGGFLYLGSIFSDKFVLEKVESIISAKSVDLDTGRIDLTGYPFSLRRYLDSAIIDDYVKPSFVRFKLAGDIWTNGNSSPVYFKASQYYNTISPGYVRDGKLQTNIFLQTRMIESFANGKANTLVKLFSSLTISDAQSKELDQSSLARYLTESVMFPASLFPSEALTWKRIDEKVSEATLKFQQMSVSAKFYFNDADEVYRVTTSDTFRATGAGYEQAPLTILYSDYKQSGDFKIPTNLILQWNLPDSVFTFGKLKITDVEYDVKELY